MSLNPSDTLLRWKGRKEQQIEGEEVQAEQTKEFCVLDTYKRR